MSQEKFGDRGQGSHLPAKFEIVDVPPMAAQTQQGPAGRGYFPDERDDEDEGGLIEYWRVLRRRKGTIIAVSAAGLVLGVLITLPQTPVYQAKTSIEVLEMNQNFMGMRDVQQVAEASGYNMMMDIQTQIKILQSEDLLNRVKNGLKGKYPRVEAAGGLGNGSSLPWADVRGNGVHGGPDNFVGGNGSSLPRTDVRGNGENGSSLPRTDVRGNETGGNGSSLPRTDVRGNGEESVWRRVLHLDGVAESAGDEDGDVAAPLRMAKKTMKARASGQTRIVEITVDSTNPRAAADFANQLTQEFIEQNVEARFRMTQKTGEFLARQLDDMRAKLERSEDALQGYAKRMGLVFTGTSDEKGGSRTNVTEEKLSQVQQELTRAQSELVAKQSRWEMASSAPADSLPDVLSDSSLQEYAKKMADLKRQEAELTETYSDDNARVKRVRAQIKATHESLARQRTDILRRIKNEYEEADRRVRLLDADYKRQTAVVTEQGEKAVQYNILKREAETNRQMYEGMLQRMKEASISSAMRASNIRVVDPARAPRLPYKPRLSLNALLGLLGGGFFAVAFVLMTEKADRTLQDPTDLAFYLNLPELGTIPSENVGAKRSLYGYGWRRRPRELTSDGGEEVVRRTELVVAQRSPSMVAESFRATLTSVLFAQQAAGEMRKALVVTSPNAAEGKTTVACNLAIAMAESGRKVLLIDGDTRRSRVHEIFDVGNVDGFTTALKVGMKGNGRCNGGSVERGEAENSGVTAGCNGFVQETKVPGLFVMTAGPGVAGPTNLLYGGQLESLLGRLSAEFDQILIDTPPLLQIPDARVIGRASGGVILVVRAGKTTRDAAVAARMRLKEDGIRVMGTVMNDWDPKMSRGGYYGNYDGYSRYYRRYYGHKIHEG